MKTTKADLSVCFCKYSVFITWSYASQLEQDTKLTIISLETDELLW